MVRAEQRPGIPKSDGSNFQPTSSESGWNKFLPGIRMITLAGVSPKMKLGEVLKSNPQIRDAIKSMRSSGLYVLPAVIFGGLIIKSAAHPDLLGHIDDKRSLRKPVGKAKELVGSMRGKFKTKIKPNKLYPLMRKFSRIGKN